MTPTEKQYIEKLEELINAWKKYEKYCAVIIGLELEAGKLSQQIEAEEKTVSDEEKELFHLCQYSEGVWCGHIMGIEDKSISIDQYMNMNPDIEP